MAALLLGVLLGAGCTGQARPAAHAERSEEAKPEGLLARTPAFEFHGAFWTDLHHFLYVVARDRLKTPQTLREALAADAPEELEKTTLPAADREAMESALAIYGKSFAERDLVFDWAGAYTVAVPPRTTMSTTDPGYAGYGALEMLFHEASHTFDSEIEKLLADEGRRQGRKIPGNLEHAIIFDTAGELAAARVPGYVPAGENSLYERKDFFREPLTRIWHPHVAGKVPVANAVRDVVVEVGRR